MYNTIIKRIKKAEQNKTTWDSYIDECYCYFLPEKNLKNAKAQETKLYESTATDSLSDYAARMESQLVPPGREWMRLEAGTEIKDEDQHEVNQALEKMTKTLFEHINSSNFSSQINECFLDLGISTGAIIVEQGDGIQSSLRFRAVPLQELIMERSEKGIIDTVFRRITIPYGDVPSIFPGIMENLEDEDKKKIKENPQDEITLIEGVMLEGMFYRNLVLLERTEQILLDQRLESSPWVIFRESTTSGETYGRGRAMRCLSDAKTLNVTMKYYIETCELLANPIYTAIDDGIINPGTIKIRPKTVIPMGAADSIRPLPMSGNPELNMDLMNRLQDSIRRTMLSKPFGKIDETPVRTATEMSIRNADLAQTSGTASGRIQTELLERLIARCVYVLKAVGKMADFTVNGKEVKIKFTSPASRQQDEIELATTMRFMQSLDGLPPELIEQTVKVEELPKFIADTLGVNPRLVRSPQEQQAKQQEQEKRQQEALAQEAQMKNGAQPQAQQG